jgi:hypothetical protein
MIKGNRKKAFFALCEILVASLKHGFSGKHPLCWNWNTSQELGLMEEIRNTAIAITEEILSDFVEIPNAETVFGVKAGKIPRTTIINQAAIKMSEYFNSKYSKEIAAKKVKFAKDFFSKRFDMIKQEWEREHEISKRKDEACKRINKPIRRPRTTKPYNPTIFDFAANI